MATEKIYDESGNSFYRVFSSDKVEKVNPIEYFEKTELQRRAIALQDLLKSHDPFLTSLLNFEFFEKNAAKTLDGFFEQFREIDLNENLERVLTTEKKKDQVNLLKGIQITPDTLMALIFKSYSKYGYLYSRYLFETMPNGIQSKKLPKIFRLKEDGSIEKIGDTDLTDGELKNIILHRKVIVSNFFEKDKVWHCFFVTYNSIAGIETWKNGQAHYHYISSGFGIPKEEFINSMKEGNYKSTSVHIDLLEYGNQG